MEKDQNYSAPMPFNTMDHYALNHHHHHLYPQNQQEHHHHHHHHHLMKFRVGETSGESNNSHGMADYIPQPQPQPAPPCFYGTTSPPLDKLSFADVMQFADFGPKLALNQGKAACEEPGIDPVFFLKFPVLNHNSEDHSLDPDQGGGGDGGEARNEYNSMVSLEDKSRVAADQEEGMLMREVDEEARVSDETNSVQLRFLGREELVLQKDSVAAAAAAQESNKNKRKRPRTVKTSEEVESQRMTHIAVERNRRKQMNEHLRVLRSLMPGSYVQRGDQASIIGGAIEFVRELEQLLQCLESQKRRRLLGEAQSRQAGDPASLAAQAPPPFFPLPNNDPMKLVELEAGGLREETAESKSCLADVEVKLLGFDAMIKILSRRRPGQLIKTIAALEDLQLIILHTNITTIEQTVLYSFNVKVASDSRFTADDIASSVQQIFSFIHANTSM